MNSSDDRVSLPNLSHEEMALLLSLGERLVAELDLQNVMQLVADTARSVVQAETLAVPIIDPDRQTFTFRAATGAFGDIILGQTFPINEGACGWVLRSRRPLLFGEGSDFELDLNAHWQKGIASSLLVPLICRGTIIGGLSAMGKIGGESFTRRDQAILTLFANQASIAIDNARLFQKSIAGEARLRMVLDSTGEGIYGIDLEGRCTFANAASLRMLGYGQESELIGRPMLPAVPTGGEDGLSVHSAGYRIRRSLHEGIESHSDTEIFWSGDGTSFPVEFWSHPTVKDGRIVGAVVTFVDITERRAAEEQIRNLAFFDSLTRLPNRRLMLDRLQQALTASARHDRHGALMLLDMDDFKTLNDTLGHDIGDHFLVEVANRLKQCVRAGDTVARQGGDEFVVILEDLDENSHAAVQAERVAEKILQSVSQPYDLGLNVSEGVSSYARSYYCTSSIGIALFRDKSISPEELMKRADTAMYQAKTGGRNTLRFFDPEMQAAVTARAGLNRDLHEALRERQFLLHYQPQVDGLGGVSGAEALLRWQHPDRGIVFPGDFIPLAELSSLIDPIGQFVLEEACRQLVSWASRPGLSHLIIAVNVSARQFCHPDFVTKVLSILERTGATPRNLKLELTESLFLHDFDDIISKMNALKARGIGFSLDDFGTGYSSLSYLKRLPLDQLKIDQSFVRNLLTDPSDAAIARAIVGLARSLGLSVIAEGVETNAQRECLAMIGCHAYQGFLLSEAVSSLEFERLVSDFRD